MSASRKTSTEPYASRMIAFTEYPKRAYLLLEARQSSPNKLLAQASFRNVAQATGWTSASGKRALERSTVCRCSMRGQDDLDRQPEQRPQVFDQLLARDTVLQHLSRDLEPATEVDQRVAGDDRTRTLDPEHKVAVRPSGERLEADRKPVTRSVQVGFPAALHQQPRDIRTVPALRDLLRSDAVLPHEVICGVGRGREHRRAE